MSWNFSRVLLAGMFVFLSGCAMVDVGTQTRPYYEFAPANSKIVEIYSSALPERDFIIIGQIELIGRYRNRLSGRLKKEAAKMGAEAVIVLAEHTSHATYSTLGYHQKSYLGQHKNKEYWMHTYNFPSEVGQQFTKWLAYAVRFQAEGGEKSGKSNLLFARDIDNLVNIYAEKLILEDDHAKYSSSVQKHGDPEEEKKRISAKLSSAGFDDLGPFERDVIALRAIKKTGISFINASPEVRKRIKDAQTLSNVASVLSFM